jgi:hypothetical protein
MPCRWTPCGRVAGAALPLKNRSGNARSGRVGDMPTPRAGAPERLRGSTRTRSTRVASGGSPPAGRRRRGDWNGNGVVLEEPAVASADHRVPAGDAVGLPPGQSQLAGRISSTTWQAVAGSDIEVPKVPLGPIDGKTRHRARAQTRAPGRRRFSLDEFRVIAYQAPGPEWPRSVLAGLFLSRPLMSDPIARARPADPHRRAREPWVRPESPSSATELAQPAARRPQMRPDGLIPACGMTRRAPVPHGSDRPQVMSGPFSPVAVPDAFNADHERLVRQDRTRYNAGAWGNSSPGRFSDSTEEDQLDDDYRHACTPEGRSWR